MSTYWKLFIIFMTNSIMNLNLILTAILSILLIMIGVDKFMSFLTPCTLLAEIQPTILKALGVIQILAGILVWSKGFKSSIAWLMAGLMIYFIIRHLVGGTSDIGGAVFLLVLCLLLIWNPAFLGDKSKV